MTPPTDELSRLLTSAADDVLGRSRAPGPDTSALWGRGRRGAWAARGAKVAVVALIALLLTTGALLASGLPTPPTPAQGGAATYPTVVSDMFVRDLPTGSGPVFGIVATVPTDSQPDDALVIERRGTVATLETTNPSSGEHIRLFLAGSGPALSPDGTRAMTSEGLVDLEDGVVTRAVDVGLGRTTGGVWSPDSQHVVVGTAAGPAVVDGYGNAVLAPAPADRSVTPAGWRDASTLVGVRPRAGGAAGGLDIVTRGLAEPGWSVVGTVALPGAGDPEALARAFASPDGSRLLVLQPGPGSGPASGLLVDTATGALLPFSGSTAATSVPWDDCDPVWQGGQPLLADGGLRRPATGEIVLSFSGHRQPGCVVLAGDELTGTAVPGAAGAWQERAWTLWLAALPYGGVLAAAGAVWMVIALRRSRRHGERFLPMIWVQRF